MERVNHPSLPDHPDLELYRRYFPRGGGSIFTVDLKGGQEGAFCFIDHLKLFSLLANVADSKSLVIHPATTTHAQLPPEEQAEQGILPGTVRLSIGTEHGAWSRPWNPYNYIWRGPLGPRRSCFMREKPFFR